MEPTAREVAAARGLECGPHQARKLDRALCQDADLILVMEGRQRDRIIQQFPEASGKTLSAQPLERRPGYPRSLPAGPGSIRTYFIR